MGTDWVTLQMGKPFETVCDPLSLTSPKLDISLDEKILGDSICIQISTVPMWPVYDNRSNRFGVTVDGQPPVVCENKIVEWAYDWKMQVLENRKDYLLSFPIDKSLSRHTMSLIIGDPGQFIQKITYQ